MHTYGLFPAEGISTRTVREASEPLSQHRHQQREPSDWPRRPSSLRHSRPLPSCSHYHRLSCGSSTTLSAVGPWDHDFRTIPTWITRMSQRA